MQQFQEIVTPVRTVAEIPRVFTYSTPRVLAVRGTADHVAGTEWMIGELDQPTDVKRADSRQYQMIDTGKMGSTAVRMFYLPYASTVQQFQEVVTLVRTIGEIRQVFTYNAPRALTVRGTPDQVALADWMIHELAKPVIDADVAPQKYTYPDVYHDGENIVSVFYLKGTPTVAALQTLATQIRTTTKIRRVFTYDESRALALRETEAQLAIAEQMLADRAREVASK